MCHSPRDDVSPQPQPDVTSSFRPPSVNEEGEGTDKRAVMGAQRETDEVPTEICPGNSSLWKGSEPLSQGTTSVAGLQFASPQ